MALHLHDPQLLFEQNASFIEYITCGTVGRARPIISVVSWNCEWRRAIQLTHITVHMIPWCWANAEPTFFFYLQSSEVSASFEYLCYGSTAIINILLLQHGDRLYTSDSGVFRRQILTSKVDPRAVGVKSYITENKMLPIWRCALLPWPTTSSGWKLLIFFFNLRP